MGISKTRRSVVNYFLKDRPQTATIANLQWSFNPNVTINKLRRHKWAFMDTQYIFLITLLVLSLIIMEKPNVFVRIPFALVLTMLMLMPITSQFFFPFMHIAAWLIGFYACQFIPYSWRPHIWVRVLPTLETIFFGSNLSNVLASKENMFLDIMAWIPYGLVHFGAPFVCSAILFLYAPPHYLPVFARSFGIMNLIGVGTQLLFPNAPPWYENQYGLKPADYSMPGSPGGLRRIDKLLGIDMYTSPFTAAPQVFGAFPSLHSASAVMEIFFMSNVFPRLAPLFTIYGLWIWWATMYLTHHYFVDLIGGALLSTVVFFIARRYFLPRVQLNRSFRWSYDYVEIGEKPGGIALSANGEVLGYGGFKRSMDLEMGELRSRDSSFVGASSGMYSASVSDDEYAVGTSSSVDGGAMSPVDQFSDWELDDNTQLSSAPPERVGTPQSIIGGVVNGGGGGSNNASNGNHPPLPALSTTALSQITTDNWPAAVFDKIVSPDGVSKAHSPVRQLMVPKNGSRGSSHAHVRSGSTPMLKDLATSGQEDTSSVNLASANGSNGNNNNNNNGNNNNNNNSGASRKASSNNTKKGKKI